MFLRRHERKKDGKKHTYWTIVENRRVRGGRVVQRHVLYLGEINSSQREAWRKSIEVFEEGSPRPRTASLFPEDNAPEIDDESIIRIKLGELTLHRPRQWGGCWLACELYEQLGLDEFWGERLPPGRKDTHWDQVLQLLVVYRLLDPGSEWRLHRQWFDGSAMADLLGSDYSLAEIHKLYEVQDLLLAHKKALFSHLQERWKDLFNARFEILLYDLTSTYFESDPPETSDGLRRFGYSRDKRSDCVQVVIALVVTPEGFPLAYEVLPGNTADNTTLRDFLDKIETQYGKADRIWLMDRGIPTEEVLEEMRRSTPPVSYLVGTPKGRLSKLEKDLAEREWHQARQGVEVKLLPRDGELYVLAQSRDRVAKERSMRRRRLRRLLKRLRQLQNMKKLGRDDLLLKIGQAKADAGRAFGLIKLTLPEAGQDVSTETFRFRLDRKKLRAVYRREGRYLLRSNLCQEDPGKLWELYIKLVEIEEAFKNLKGDLSIRPIFHQKDERIESHIFISFLAYCLHVTLRRRLRDLAPGLTPRAVLEKFAAMQMIDVHLPTDDGRIVMLSRYTQPEKELQMLIEALRLELPAQPPPRITAKGELVE
jgi:transposase